MGNLFITELTSPLVYCAFHKHGNSKVQKPPSQLCFSLPSIMITITSNEPWNTEKHKTDRNPPITNHKTWPFEPIKVKSCFLRGPLRWLTAAKNAIVSWLLNFRIRMFMKSAVNKVSQFSRCGRANSRLPMKKIKSLLQKTRKVRVFVWKGIRKNTPLSSKFHCYVKNTSGLDLNR